MERHGSGTASRLREGYGGTSRGVACLERGEAAGRGGFVLVSPPFSATAAVLLREAVGKSAEKLSVPILFRGVVGGELEVVMAASRMLEAGAVLVSRAGVGVVVM